MLWEKTDERLLEVTHKIVDDNKFNKEFTYSHDKKKYYRMTYEELFLHLSHHSYYHRGQLAMIFRQCGLNKAPVTDADGFFAKTTKSTNNEFFSN